LTSVALGAAVLALATGCTEPAADPVEEHTFGMHQVITFWFEGEPNEDATHRQMLESYGWELTDSALAAMAWYLAADCGEQAPSTQQFVVACDSSDSLVFLLQPATLTAQDIASAQLMVGDAAQDLGANEGDLRLRFTKEGAEVFNSLTGALAFAISPANQMAIVVDGVVVSAPVVTEPNSGNSVIVTSSVPDPKWNDLAAWLNAQASS
jgi:hypothetical protein